MPSPHAFLAPSNLFLCFLLAWGVAASFCMENGSVADKNTSLEALFPHRRLSIAIIQVVAVILLLSALIYNAFFAYSLRC